MTAAPSESASRQYSRNVALDALIVAAHFGLVAIGMAFGGQVTPAAGEIPTIVSGLFFLFWAAVLTASYYRPHASFVLNFLQRWRPGHLRPVAIGFAIVATFLILSFFGLA